MTDTRTPYLNLLKLRGGLDALSTEDYAFVSANMDLIDAALRAAMNHHHNGEPVSVAGAPDAPDLELAAVEGGLPGGQDVRYVVTRQSAAGLESIASGIATITTPDPLPTPEGMTAVVSATGGELPPGLYMYAVTTWGGFFTRDTLAGIAVPATLPTISGDTQKVTLNLPELADGADGFNIYRRLPGSTTFNLLASVTSDVPFVDDGTVTADAERILPTVDRSADDNAVNVTVPTGLTAGEKWIVYRTTAEGEWANTKLAEIAYGEPTTITDYGGVTYVGTPPLSALNLTNPQPIDLATETAGSLPGERLGSILTSITSVMMPIDEGGDIVVDGTATALLVLDPTPGSPASGDIPAGWTFLGSYAVEDLGPLLEGLGPDGLLTYVPVGPTPGVYRLTSTGLGDPWPLVNPAVIGFGSTTDYLQLLVNTPIGYIRIYGSLPDAPTAPAEHWDGPTGPRGGTITIASGDVVFVPWRTDKYRTTDRIRLATSTAGATGAKVRLYLAFPDPTTPDRPGDIVTSIEVDVDVLGEALEVFTAGIIQQPDTWWLGVHNHIAAVTPAEFHALAPDTHLPPLAHAGPAETFDHSCIIATAGTTPLSGDDATGLTYTPASEAPIIHCRTPEA